MGFLFFLYGVRCASLNVLVSSSGQCWLERTFQCVVECSADCCAGDRKHVKTSYTPRPIQHSPISSSRSPWSQIPTHMLSMPPSSSFGQMRAYSSDSKNGTAGEFGFQSLGSLFPAPPTPGRYSRPRERRAEEVVSKEPEAQAPVLEVQRESSPEQHFVQPTPPPKTTESKLSEESATQIEANPVRVAEKSNNELVRKVHKNGPSRVGRRREMPTSKRSVYPAKLRAIRAAQPERKMRNPFAGTVEKSASSDEATAEPKPNTKAWGLSQEDQDTVDSIADPSAPLVAKESSRSQEPAASVESVPATPAGPRLTHVKSSGEAHMVDVGHKASTKRVAIAVATIGVSREVYDQIVENSNKKGDVLGIARIAGIMAAKRTSDIIPLCHPLAISKAEVDVFLVPVREQRFTSEWFPGGRLVAIQARVECVGPTGVEMEAMMAVQGAALTVIDMCKAVDKTMAINGAKVVYKAGGRSGLSCDFKWAKAVGLHKFMSNGELKDGVDAVPEHRTLAASQ